MKWLRRLEERLYWRLQRRRERRSRAFTAFMPGVTYGEIEDLVERRYLVEDLVNEKLEDTRRTLTRECEDRVLEMREARRNRETLPVG